MIKAVPLSMLVVLCYMCAAAWLASWQKTVSNTLLCIGSLLLVIYFMMRIFGNSSLLFSWITSFFYLHPLEIAAQEYAAKQYPVYDDVCAVAAAFICRDHTRD